MADLTGTINDKVNEIWESNPKIPFMQAKEILRLGYELGTNASINKGKEAKQNKKISKTNDESSKHEVEEERIISSNEFVGTSKEFIKKTNDMIIDRLKDKGKEEYEEKTKILKIQIELTGNILNYMAANRDFIDVYTHIKEMNNDYQNALYHEQTNNGDYKSKRFGSKR